MLKPIMMKHILAISLLLFFLVLPRHADARLVLGAVSGEADGGIATEQVEALAVQVAEKLGGEVTVKWLPDTDSVLSWLDRYATLDLALVSADVLEKNRGSFLIVGPLAQDSSIHLIARQGVKGDVPKRLADLVSVSGASRWRTAKPAASEQVLDVTGKQDVPSVSVPVQQKDPLQVVDQRPVEVNDRAWEAGEVVQVPELQPEPALPTKKLVLGVVPEPTGVIRTTQQAEELKAYLEAALPVTVTVREFTKLETFAEWFLRYRMVDLVVISPELAMLNLGRDYMPVAKLYRSDKPGPESAELVVMRSGHDEELQAQIQQALLDMPGSPGGQQQMAKLQISQLFAPGLDRVAARPEIVEVVPTPVAPVEPAPEVVETGEAPELPEPVEAEPHVDLPPAIVDVVEPAPTPTLPDVPAPAVLPEDKVEDVVAEVPPQQPVAPAEPEAVVLPVLPEGVLAPAEEPAMPEDVAVVEVAPAKSPQKVAALPEMPGLPKLPAVDQLPETPAVKPSPQLPEIEVAEQPILDVPVAKPAVEVPEIIESAVPAPPVVSAPVPVVVVEGMDDVVEEPVAEATLPEETSIVEEVLEFAEPVSSHELQEEVVLMPDGDDTELTELDLVAVLGENPVASMVAQPDLPQELRPTGIPMVRPAKVKPSSVVEEELLVAALPEAIPRIEPPKPPKLLPEPEPEPGIVYVVPFVSVMVPQEVSAGIFDKFIDMLNQEGEALGLQFLILKEGLQRVAPDWLAVRKYVTGELYAYVEDRGATSTDLRTKARLTYRVPNQEDAAFSFEYPVRNFFNHDHSTISVERAKMSNNIADTLAKKLINALKN